MVSQMTRNMIDRFITHAQYIYCVRWYLLLKGRKGKGGKVRERKKKLREDSYDSLAKQTSSWKQRGVYHLGLYIKVVG